MAADVADRIARCFRDDAGRAVAKLARAVGDLTLAEDAVADAYVTALERWPADGFPAQPSAWILTTARRRAIDRLRRERVGREKAARLAALESVADGPAEDPMTAAGDERLGLMFACCHPALGLEARVALTLHALGGLTTAEIADAFLVPRRRWRSGWSGCGARFALPRFRSTSHPRPGWRNASTTCAR
jgi:RNA polymerase sigma-70 factor (ECF subfamily)